MRLRVQRVAKWDLMRTLAMFLVVVVHSSCYLGTFGDFDAGVLVNRSALICDGIFFALSGYLALGPQERSLKDYYLNKFITVLFPLILYSVLLYCYASQLSGMTLEGYLAFFVELLQGQWWFVPALVPCLIVAPFIGKGLQALSDKTVKDLFSVLAVLCASGAVLMFGQWLFEMLGNQPMNSLFELLGWLVPPSALSLSIKWFHLFLLGGLTRRILPLLATRASVGAILIGFAALALDVSFTMSGIPLADPSFFWFFTTFGAFVLIDKVKIRDSVLEKSLSWTSRRSYTIYLLQGEVIVFFAAMFYDVPVLGVESESDILLRIALWSVLVMFSYLSSLALASAFDSLLLRPLQALLRLAFGFRRKSDNPEGEGSGHKGRFKDSWRVKDRLRIGGMGAGRPEAGSPAVTAISQSKKPERRSRFPFA